jgi:hypothetical protein
MSYSLNKNTSQNTKNILHLRNWVSLNFCRVDSHWTSQLYAIKSLNNWTLNHLLVEKIQGYAPAHLRSQHFGQPINMGPSFMCASVSIFHTYWWFINIESMANGTAAHTWQILSNIGIFSVRHTTASCAQEC